MMTQNTKISGIIVTFHTNYLSVAIVLIFIIFVSIPDQQKVFLILKRVN